MIPLLALSNLSIGYNHVPLCSPLSLEVFPCDKLLVCGANGSGKSTLLKTILGIEKPLGGTIKYTGKNSIAYCKQDFPNPDFPVTAEEVVAMGLYKKHYSANQVEQSMKKTDCWQLRKRLFYTLSGGERQRVSLARCFCQNSSLLLLDEPSSFLDAQSKETFLNLLQGMRSEPVAIIAVTHDEEIIASLGWKVIRLGEARNE